MAFAAQPQSNGKPKPRSSPAGTKLLELQAAASERDELRLRVTRSEEQEQALTAQVTSLQDRLQSQGCGLDRLQEENRKLQESLNDSALQMQEAVQQYEERLEVRLCSNRKQYLINKLVRQTCKTNFVRISIVFYKIELPLYNRYHC